MLAVGAYEKCKRYIKQHSTESEKKKEVYPCITISRQTGSGSYEVSEKLIDILQRYTKEPDDPWTYFNKELIEKVIEDFKLPKVFTNYIIEDKYNHIKDAVNELLGVRPSEWTIVHKSTEIILQLARYGKVIIVGRGSNVITSKLSNSFHIRLIAPIENRIKHVQEVFDYSKSEAMEYIKREDVNRNKYLRSHFFHDPNDETLYHLVINTGKLSYSETAELIANTVVRKYPGSFYN
ncbi:MAG: cytidylate kinase-like family protein [Ignavibacteriaceae bacterium]